MSEFDNEIVNMYESGIAVREICSLLPCSRQTIYNILNKYGVKLDYTHGRRNDGISKEQIFEMYELYLQGKNTREIGEIYNLIILGEFLNNTVTSEIYTKQAENIS